MTDVALGNVTLEAALTRINLDTGSSSVIQAAMPATNGHVPEQGILDVLVTGPRPPDPGEFVGSRRLADILHHLHERYDLVIIDTPPVLRVGDAMTLSTVADAILVVTRLNVIRRPMLSELRRLLDDGARNEARLRRHRVPRKARAAATGTATATAATGMPSRQPADRSARACDTARARGGRTAPEVERT